MEENIDNIKEIIQHYTLDKFEVALISVVVSILTFLVTSWLKNYFQTKLHIRNLESEHTFSERKKIKEVLAKNKIHLLTACEDLNHRMWNFAKTHGEQWMKVNGDYVNDHHYFHSFMYRILKVYAWIKIIQKEMIFLDTTIATKQDLEFIKFLRIFPQIFCDLSFVEGKNADGSIAKDHFFRNQFDLFPDAIIKGDDVKSFSSYMEDVRYTQQDLLQLYRYLDGISPNEENRKRWDRLHLLNLTLIAFLNNYGYDFQQTDDKKFREVLTEPKLCSYTQNLFKLFKEYHLDDNKEIKKLEKVYKDVCG